MRRRAVALAVLLAAAAPVAALWDHSGGDAARTGAADAGPRWPDVAFQVQLQGTPAGNPVFRDGAIWIGTRGDQPGLDQAGLWRIDPATGDVLRVAERPSTHFVELVGDLALVRPNHGAAFEGVDLATGTTRWNLPGPPSLNGQDVDVDWGRPALSGDTLFLPFVADPDDAASTEQPQVAPIAVAASAGLLAIDARTGETLWEGPAEPAHRANLTGVLFGTPVVAANEDIVVFYVLVRRSTPATPGVQGAPQAPVVRAGETHYRLFAFDRATGAFEWERSDPVPADAAVGPTSVLPLSRLFQGGGPILTPGFVFVRTDRFLALNPGTGAVMWESEAGLADRNPVRGTLVSAWNDGTLVATSTQTAYRLDPASGAPLWQLTETDPSFAYVVSGGGLSTEVAYMPFIFQNGSRIRGLDALDVATGERLWRWADQDTLGPLNNTAFSQGYGGGLAVTGRWDGTVTVLGRTSASLRPPDLDAEAYPDAGDEVRVDLSATGPGVHGPATRYRADWGEGNVTPWQPSPVFTHVYMSPGPRTARFEAANDANQTASVVVTYRVGESRFENAIESAFSDERQERTFFVLGLAATGAGGLAGLVLLRRKRARLRKEMAAVDRVYLETKHDPGVCDLALRERRARARGLVLDGALDEAQGAILERHIDDLARRARLSELDEGLDFLPMGIARRLREALEDGRVSSLERDLLVRLVADDRVLTPEQKTQVQMLVDQWWRRDRAGGP